MPALNRWTLLAAACLLGLAPRVFAQSIDFESSAYVTEKTVVGADGWTASTDPVLMQYPENFKVQAGPEGKFLHVLTTSQTTIYRLFNNIGGILDVRWKWRALSDSAHFCASVSTSVTTARTANRALTCLEANGKISTQGLAALPSASGETWTKGQWHYMRMVLDNTAGVNKFTVFITEDSLRGNERLVAPASTMGGSGAYTRFVLRDESGNGYIDFDDLSWDVTAVWQGGAASGGFPGQDVDTLWSTARNWSTGAAPDSATHVLFTEAYPRGCLLDKNAAVRSISVASGYKGDINLGQQNLAVWGKGDFTGGNYLFAGAGHLRFPSARGSSLIPPEAFRTLAPVRHDGPGPLRLDQRNLNAAALTQVQGSFDFNGWDMVLNGDFTVKNGQPGTLRNLDGRTLSVGRAARLEGSSKDTLLGLATAPKGWILSGSITSGGSAGSATDSLQARFATLGNARVSIGQGYAYQSVDAGGNTGWAFISAPAILAQPRDTAVKVGEAAQFRVSASSKLPMTFQWFRNDKAIPDAVDSVFTVLTAFKADSGATFSCKLANAAGNSTTAAARLKVGFPAPAILPAPQPIADSLSVKLTASVAGATTWYSRNGGAYVEYKGEFTLRDSTLVRAFSVFNMDTSAAVSFNFPKSSPPQLAEPVIEPGNASFADTLRVTITPPAAGASVYYTLDGTDADSITGLPYRASFLISKTTTVSAIAYLAGYQRSNVRNRIYIRKDSETIPAPTASPAGGFFSDSVIVKLSPPAAAPEASVYYFTGSQGPFRYSDSLVLRASGSLKAIAISGSKYSDTAAWEFRRRIEAPAAAPKARSFADTIRIALTTKIAGADIRYTWDGSDPTGHSPRYDGHPLLLDSSATLKAVSISGDEVSGVLSETYTLIPDAPSASHRGGDYSSLITITLGASSARAAIYYTLDGSTPGPERPQTAYAKPFNLDTSATLKAVAVAGVGAKSQSGPLLIENYTFISPGKRVLGPGARIELSNNYSLSSRLAGASPVDVEVLAADGLKTPAGFRDILFGVRFSLPEGAPAFPKIMINAPKGEPRSLYAYQTQDQAAYVSGNDTIEVSAPGTYFLALDTSAPVITYSGETFTSEDSTRLMVSIKDNISNLLLDLERSDKPSEGFHGKEINGMPLLNVSLQNPKGSLLPLTVRLKVDDHVNAASFPKDGSPYALAQRFSGTVRTPAAFHIGVTEDDPWDLIAIPLALEPALTLAQLRKNNSAPSLRASTLDPKTGSYRDLAANEPMPTGASIWLGASTSIPSLAFPALQTASRHGAAAYTLTLHHGWNQVANPCLTPMYWPVTRAFPDAYEVSPLKGLHIYNPSTGSYDHAESLEPWRGYFAWYKGERDTLVTLRTDPVPAPVQSKAAKSGAASHSAAAAGFRFRLRLAGGPGVTLGATPRAIDGAGLEDEPQPAGRRVDAPRLYSARPGLRLETDLVKWTPGAVSGWTLIMGLPQGNPHDTSAADGARVEGLEMPVGYSAWAVSRTRGMRFPIAPGSDIPMHAGFVDTLDVIAGPVPAVDARLASIPVSVGVFGLGLEAAPASFALRLRLPEASRLRLKVWSPAGRLVESGSFDLPEGVYRLVRNRDGRGYSTGMYVLSLEWAGGGKSGRLTRKIAIP